MQRRRITCGVRGEPQYLTGVDIFNTHVGVPSVFVYPQGLDAAALRDSLPKVLARYPVLAGRLRTGDQGQPCIDLNDAGIDFKVHRCRGRLPAYGPDRPLWPVVGAFFSPIVPWRVVDRDQPLVVLELHEFEGGGAILSITGVHSVLDGGAFWSFMLDWVRVHQGHDILAPVIDRNAVIRHSQAHMHLPYRLGLVHPQSAWRRAGVYSHLAWNLLGGYDKHVFRVQAETLERWKAQARESLPQGEQPSPGDLVGAHCLRMLSPHMRSGRDRGLAWVTDLRFRRNLSLPRKYVGNAVLQLRVSLSADELARHDLSTLAARCRLPLEAASTDDVLGFMAWMERHRQTKTIGQLLSTNLTGALRAGLVLNSCTHFPIYKIDFGAGPPSWHDHPRVPYRAAYLSPAPSRDGAIDVHLSAPRREVAAVRAQTDAAPH